MQMSITQALNELKLLDSRIKRGIQSASFTATHMNDRKIKNTKTLDEFDAEAKASWDSINTLIENRARIKSRIVGSNAVTKVKIGENEMTVAEAIERKSSIEYEKALLKQMSIEYMTNQAEVSRNNTAAAEKAYSQLETVLGGKDTVKTSDENTVKSIYDPVYKRYEYLLRDPLSVTKKIDQMQDKIETFASNIDFVLSTSNAITTIEV